MAGPTYPDAMDDPAAVEAMRRKAADDAAIAALPPVAVPAIPDRFNVPMPAAAPAAAPVSHGGTGVNPARLENVSAEQMDALSDIQQRSAKPAGWVSDPRAGAPVDAGAPKPTEVPPIRFSGGSAGRLVPTHEEQRGRTVQSEAAVPIPQEAIDEFEAANVDKGAAAQMGVENDQETARAQKQSVIAQQVVNRQSIERQRASADAREEALISHQRIADELTPDPKKTWANMNDFTRVRFAIGSFLGHLAEARTGKNPARETIAEYVKNDMASQEAAYDANAKRMAWARDRFDSRDDAMATIEAAKLRQIELEVQRQLAGVKDKAALQRGSEIIAGLREDRGKLLDSIAQRAADKRTESTSYATVQAQMVGGSGPTANPADVKRAAEAYLANRGDPAKLPEFLRMQGVGKQTIGAVMMGLSTPTGAYEQNAKAAERADAEAAKAAPSAATYVPEAGGFATSVEDAKAIKEANAVRVRFNNVLDQMERIQKNASVIGLVPGGERAAKREYAALRAQAVGIVTSPGFQNAGASLTEGELRTKIEPLIPDDPFTVGSMVGSGSFDASVSSARSAVDNAFRSNVTARGVAPGRLERRGNRIVPVIEGAPESTDTTRARDAFVPAEPPK